MIPVHVPIPKTGSRSIAVLGRELSQTGLHERASVLRDRHPGALLWASLRTPDDWYRSWYDHLRRGGRWDVLGMFGRRSGPGWHSVREGVTWTSPEGLPVDALWRPEGMGDGYGLYSRMMRYYLDVPVRVVLWDDVPAFVREHYGSEMPHEERGNVADLGPVPVYDDPDDVTYEALAGPEWWR